MVKIYAGNRNFCVKQNAFLCITLFYRRLKTSLGRVLFCCPGFIALQVYVQQVWLAAVQCSKGGGMVMVNIQGKNLLHMAPVRYASGKSIQALTYPDTCWQQALDVHISHINTKIHTLNGRHVDTRRPNNISMYRDHFLLNKRDLLSTWKSKKRLLFLTKHMTIIRMKTKKLPLWLPHIIISNIQTTFLYQSLYVEIVSCIRQNKSEVHLMTLYCI